MTVHPYAFPPGTPAVPRNLYWVGGSNTWNSTAGTKWALTSGGVGGQAIPTSIDNVFFDANSGAVSVPLSSTAGISVCKDITCTGFTGTLMTSNNDNLYVYGSLTFVNGMTLGSGSVNGIGPIRFVAGSGSHNVDFANKTVRTVSFGEDNNTDPIITTATWTLQNPITISSITGGYLHLSGGTLNTNGKAVTTSRTFLINCGGSPALTLGASSVTCSFDGGVGSAGSSATFSVYGDASLFTLNAGTSTITLSAINSQFFGGGKTYYNVSFTGATSTNTGVGSVRASTMIGDSNTFNNLSVTGTSSKVSSFYLDANQTVTGTFTANGNSAVNRLLVASTIRGTQRTITAATVSADKVDFSDIVGAGAGNWNLSAAAGFSGNCGNNSGITFTTPATCYWIGGTSGSYTTVSRWSSSSGGAANTRVPIAQDSAIFDANSFNAAGRVLTMDQVRVAGLDFSAVTNNPTFTKSVSAAYFGSFILKSGMAVTGSFTSAFSGRGSYTLATNGVSWNSSAQIYIVCVTGTYSLGSNLTTNSGFNVVSGTCDFADYNVVGTSLTVSDSFSVSDTSGCTLDTCNGTVAFSSTITHNGGTITAGSGTIQCTSYTASGATVILNMGSGTWTLTSTGTIWTGGTGTTINCDTSTISCTNTSASTKTFTGSGHTYYALTIAGAASCGQFTISGSNTFNDLTFAANSNIRLLGTQTQTVNNLCTATGTAGNTIDVHNSSGGGTVATISSANNVVWDYVTLTALEGTGGGLFIATNSTDGGGNINWTIIP